MYIDPLSLNLENDPTNVEGRRGATLNGTGYIFYNPSPLALEFIENEAKPDKSVFEIGSGFSNIPLLSLKNGSGNYIASDLSRDHLGVLVKRIRNEFPEQADDMLRRLKLLQAKAPYDLPDYENEFDAIMMHAVFHFLNPEEVEVLMAWVKKALKNNGKLYIVTATPFTRVFRDAFLPIYEENSRNGVAYPGYVADTTKIIDYDHVSKSHPNYQVPKQMLLISLPDLIKLFEKNGFEICHTTATRWPDALDSSWSEMHPTSECFCAGVVGKVMK